MSLGIKMVPDSVFLVLYSSILNLKLNNDFRPQVQILSLNLWVAANVSSEPCSNYSYKNVDLQSVFFCMRIWRGGLMQLYCYNVRLGSRDCSARIQNCMKVYCINQSENTVHRSQDTSVKIG